MQYQFLFICQKFNIYSSKYAFFSFILAYLPHFQSSFSLLYRTNEQFLNWLIQQVVKNNKFKKKGMIARFLFAIIFLSKSEGIILRWAIFRVYFSNNIFHCLFWFISFWVYQFIYCYCPLLFWSLFIHRTSLHYSLSYFRHNFDFTFLHCFLCLEAIKEQASTLVRSNRPFYLYLITVFERHL